MRWNAVTDSRFQSRLDLQYSILGANAKHAEVVKKRFHHKYDAIIAVRIWRAEKETFVGDERQGIVNDSFGNLTVFKSDLDPQALDLWIAFEELHLDIVGTTFERFHKEERLGIHQLNDAFAAVGQLKRNLRRQRASDRACGERIK